MARDNIRGVREKIKEDIPEEESSFTTKLNGIKNKLKLGPHHKMERFTIMLGTTSVFLLLMVVFSFGSYRSDISNLASAQAIFNDEFRYSLSNQKGYIEGVFGNEDKTDVMVLFRMQNPNDVSANAENYNLFVTGQKRKLRYEPDVSFSLFGTTGYGIIRFQHEDGIRQEILDVTIRSNVDLAVRDGRGAGDSEDGSFDEFDQARFFVNPGAENVQILDGIRPGETDPEKLYIAMVAEEEDAEIQEEIVAKTEELGQLLNRAEEYRNRLISAGYIPPETPWFVEGDYVDDNGVFRPASFLARAHKIDYWSGDIKDGYLHQVIGDISEFSDYMSKHSTEARGSDSLNLRDEARSEQVDRVTELEHEDGTVLELNTVTTGSSASSQVSAKDSVEALTNTWRNYVTEKGRLQKDLLSRLLILDADVKSQPTNYSEHNSEGVVEFY